MVVSYMARHLLDRESLEQYYERMLRRYQEHYPGHVVLLEIPEVGIAEMIYGSVEDALRDIEAHASHELPYLLKQIPLRDLPCRYDRVPRHDHIVTLKEPINPSYLA